MKSNSEKVQLEGELQASPRVKCSRQRQVTQNQENCFKQLVKLQVIRAPLCSSLLFKLNLPVYTQPRIFSRWQRGMQAFSSEAVPMTSLSSFL